MTDKRAKVPGSGLSITIERNPARVVVVVAGRVIADTCEAVTLLEASYAPVQYVPRKDVDMSALERTAHTTYCPYKGECSYYSIALAVSILTFVLLSGSTQTGSQRDYGF